MVIKNKTEALDATLALVARGNAVLAEIERLSDNIPLLYRNISTGWTKKSVFSKNENRPWWGFFEKKIS